MNPFARTKARLRKAAGVQSITNDDSVPLPVDVCPLAGKPSAGLNFLLRHYELPAITTRGHLIFAALSPLSTDQTTMPRCKR